MTFTDTSRRLRPSHGGGPRILPTEVFYPTGGSKRGPFPLVVFAHGFGAFPRTYQMVFLPWVKAGYVVAAPTFPLTHPGAPGGETEDDVPNQPADVSFVISKLLAANATAGNPLHGLIAPDEIAVAGHSDGGETAMAVTYNTCCQDRSIKAAVVLAGSELTVPGGTYFRGPTPPVLVVQGTADQSNAPWHGYLIYDKTRGPAFLLKLQGATHDSPFLQEGPEKDSTEKAVVDFLDFYLKQISGALNRLRSDVTSARIGSSP